MKTKSFNKLTAWLVTFTMMLTLIPAFNLSVFAENSQIEAGDFTIASTDGTTALTDGTDYSFADGKLTVKTTTPVTVSMKDGVETTDDIIIADSANGETYITLDSVKIDTDNMGNTSDNQPITVKGANKITLDFSGTNSLSSNVEGTHSQVIGINAESKTPLVLTSTDSGSLSISDVDYGIYLKGYTTGGSISVNGSIDLDISNCLNHAIYAQNAGTVTISDTPEIDIDTGDYAIYAKEGIAISGGVINIKNDDGYAICGATETYITLCNDAEVNITEGDRGMQVSKGKMTITDNAKYTVYDESTGERTPAILDFAISSGELEISQNAVVDVFTQEDGISGGVTSIKDNAQVSVKIDCESTYSQNSVSFDDTLDISDNAKLDIDVVNGTKIRGINDYSGAVNVSVNAALTINGTTYDGIYVKNLNLSDKASITVNANVDNAIDGAISVKDGASLLATSVDTRVINDPCTVTPASSKAYMVKYGKSEAEATTSYYTETTTISDKSTWRYFSVSPMDVLPVTITGEDKTITYDGSKYDMSQMFSIDANAGTATYSIVGGTGNGTISGNELTITKAGTIEIKVDTAANGSYLSGNATATLTVNKGVAPQITFPTASAIAYGDTLENSTFTGGNENGRYVWKEGSIIPTVTNSGYTVKFVPDDAELYDYSNTELEKNVDITVSPRPVSITWNLPESLVYDGTDKTISAEVENKVGNDNIELTTDGTITAKNVGDYTATVTNIDNGNYTLENGENLTKNWSVSAKALTADSITPIADTTYTGEEIKPVLEIKDGDTVLTLDTDYTVEHQNNINTTGETKAKAVVTFRGNYAGTADKEFVILPKTINTAVALTAPVKNAAPQTSIETDEYTATVVWNPEVESNFAYSTVYTATVTITPKANYTTSGIAENSYTFNGAETVTNSVDSGEITVIYPATGRRSSGGGGGSSNTTTTTTKNDDGSTTKTTTNKSTGTTTEVTTNTDGSTTTVETKKDGTVTTTEKDKDGNTTTTVEKSDGTSVTTEKTKDGTTTVTEKAADGTTTTTETDKAGNKTVTTENTDGSTVTEETRKDGTTVKTETTKDGETTAEITVPDNKETEVVIPVENAGEVTKVVATDKDGKETEVEFEVKENSIAITVSDDCTVSLMTGHNCYTDDFTDTDVNAWYHENVDYVLENGLMNGTATDKFAPNDNLTRAMLVTILYRAEGEPEVPGRPTFDDIEYDAYYAKAVRWAELNNIVSGYSEIAFAPNDNITREQIATILYRYAIYKGMDAVNLSENLGFADADAISEYAISALNWAVGAGLITGYEDNTVRPQNNATRAEAAAILQRFIEANK